MPLSHRASGPHHRPAPDGDALRRENERLRQQVEQLRQQLKELADQQAERLASKDQEIADAGKKIADAEKQICDLERQLALRLQNSTTSSKPPSSDGLAGEPRERGRRKKSKRKPGGQPGHVGACRPLAPPERVDEVRPVLPIQCRQCGHALPQTLKQVEADCSPRRHQVTELPPIRAHIIEYQCHGVICPECGDTTRAAIPEEAAGQFGPQLTALIAYLTVVCRMPRRVVEALLKQTLEIDISLGSTQKCWEEASQAVAAPCQELEQHLKQEPVLNADETGWRTNGSKRYLWVFVAAQYIVYTVAPTRGGQVLIEMLGSVFEGILCSDRFSAYLKYHAGRRAQFCWAHLKRNLLGVMDLTKNNEVEQFCRDALAEHARLFRLWHKFRDDGIDRRQLVLRSIPIQKRLFALGERHLDSSHRDVRNLAVALFDHIERLFAFVDYQGVEPTNNSAERALRTAVQWRKTSFGNRSASGELATARLLTVTETCDLQKLNILAYLSDAITSHRRRQTPASLLPR
jgi:transposase